MGEVTQVKLLLPTELCGIGGVCLHFAFVLSLPVVGFVLLQCHDSHEVCRSYLGVILETPAFVFEPLAYIKHFLSNFRWIWKWFFERKFLGALTLTVPYCWSQSPHVHWVHPAEPQAVLNLLPANIHSPAVRGAVCAVALYIQPQQYTEKVSVASMKGERSPISQEYIAACAQQIVDTKLPPGKFMYL